MVSAAERRVPPVVQPSQLTDLGASWDRSLRAAARSTMTRRGYLQAVNQLDGFLERQGMPRDVAHIKREHVEAFIIDIAETRSPSTAATRFRALYQFFKWLEEEGELRQHPMLHMKEPKAQERPVPVLREDDLRRLLKACEGADHDARRDMAILRLLLDTGIRRSECAGLMVTDVDFDLETASVLGKGNRRRNVPFGAKTAQALDRYLRVRRAHPHAATPNLWLGRKGPMSDQALYEAVKRRAAEAGLPDTYVHQLRHTFAHNWLAQGGTEQSLMRLAGWRSRTMLGRYGGSAADERAHEDYRRAGSPGDRL